MRRGGRGSNLRSPCTPRHDAPIVSAVHWNRGRTARNCVCVAVLAVCSLAMSILIWSFRYRSSGDEFRSSGMVFPLYHYHRNGSHGMGWRVNRAGRGRRLQGSTDVLTKLFGGHRLDIDDIQHFYIEMKLGAPPKKYNFHVDTGSGVSWVYCQSRTLPLKISDWGPNGLFAPEDSSFVSCAGDTAALCQQLQASSSRTEPCEPSNNYQCLFASRYADESIYVGYVVNGSFTVAMEDNSERNMFGAFGCVNEKIRKNKELLPLLTDGLIGLGNCQGTLMDQWTTGKNVRQRVLGVCLAKGVEWTSLPSPATPVGYVSMGMDFKEKFDQSKSVWSELTDPGKMIPCAYAAKLLFVSFDTRKMVYRSPIIIDSGSDITYLAKRLYSPLLNSLDNYATSKGYRRVPDNPVFIVDEQRLCWAPPAQTLAKASPILDFLPVTFAFQGIPGEPLRDRIQYLIVQPANYLVWDAKVTKLCVNILEDVSSSTSNIGADMMREHLFVLDMENKRVRWQLNNCELN